MLVYVNHDEMRSLELMEEMIRRGYYVSDEFKDMRYADVIYMGVKGIDRKNRLLTHQDTMTLGEDLFLLLKKDCLIITLVYNEYLNELSKLYHFSYLALLNQKAFIEKNSILTAEGLLSYIIMHRREPIYHSIIYVLGFGHCAKPIVQYLLALKAEVRVAVRRHELKDDIERMGAQYIDLKTIDLSDADILINTVPALIIHENELKNAKKGIMIIDIASYPYGIDHHYALSQGLNSQILPSIPCKYAYGYAGKMIADEIERELNDA